MASADHQDSPTGAMPGVQNMSGHQANLVGAQQRQQQELIKLIAQHFHNQFYQLANNTSNGLQASISPQHQHTHHHHHQQQQQQQQQQQLQLNRARLSNCLTEYQPHRQIHQNQSHYQNLPGFPINGGRGLDLNTMNHVLATGQSPSQQQFLSNPLIRSQQMNATQNGASTITGLGFPNTSGLDFSTLAATGLSSSPYPAMVDLGLFNALGLNLINNQGAQSPQRQPSFAHNNIGQYGENTQNNPNADRSQHTGIRGTKGTRTTIGGNSADSEANQHEDGRGMLKFSINTILGRGSPKSTSPINEDSHGDRPNSLDDDSKDNCDENLDNNSRLSNANQDRQQQQLRVSECDLASEYNDSNSSSANSTPAPQTKPPSSSISVKLPFINHHHHNQHQQHQQHQQATTTSPDHLNVNHYQHGPNFINPASSSIMGASNIQRPGQPNQQPSCHPSAAPPPLFLTAGSTTFPWTVAARGKPRRGMMRRAVFSDSQRVGLEKRFQLQKYISKPDRKKLAEKLGLRDSQVKIWFQNRRMKWRNSKERELLSAGGSREQTLPTRNNPNPDLSDVGETVKRLTSAINGGPSSNNSQSK